MLLPSKCVVVEYETAATAVVKRKLFFSSSSRQIVCPLQRMNERTTCHAGDKLLQSDCTYYYVRRQAVAAEAAAAALLLLLTG